MSIDAYLKELEQWRLQKAQSLEAEDGWLSVAGLHWLAPGPNPVDTDAHSPIALPGDFGEVGVLDLRGEEVWFEPAAGVLVDGRAAQSGYLKNDTQGPPSKVSLGTVRFVIVRRGERFGVRVFDNAAPSRLGFQGLSWFEPDPAFRVEGRLEPHLEARQVPIINLLGDTHLSPSPGFVAFELGGHSYRLLAESPEPEKSLFFNFRDATSGPQTYGAGRFLTTEGLRDGRVVLDFNKAVHPPCAYTPYATCPIAPAENRLTVAITAGQKLA